MATFTVIELWPHETECALCGAFLYLREALSLPMYEGRIVPDDWPGPWAGFPVCTACHQKHREVS